MHTGKDCEETESKDYVGVVVVVVGGRVVGAGGSFCSSHSPRFEHRTGTWHFNGVQCRRVRWEDGKVNSVEIPLVRTQAAPIRRKQTLECWVKVSCRLFFFFLKQSISAE